MKKRDPEILVDDIAKSIAAIRDYTLDLSKKEFNGDKKTQDAVFKRIENMGEAVKNLPYDFRRQYPDIPWKKIAGMRDVLVHDYFGIDTEKVWNVVANEIPDLKEKIAKIIGENKQKKLL
ncbi:MAG: DUF86 domain-containing protein [Candidatus Nealsonbacteria bacterium DGGOD1a]|jgi:uncharacterized protein with HEPN domain|nr:MAG: DUF86 domain-containing protein [Candidatus Nealsonbacteria bacterium DGGOD1a]